MTKAQPIIAKVLKYYTPKFRAELESMIPSIQVALNEERIAPKVCNRFLSVYNKAVDYTWKITGKAINAIGKPHFEYETPQYEANHLLDGPVYDIYSRPAELLKKCKRLRRSIVEPEYLAAIDELIEMANDMIPVKRLCEKLESLKVTKSQEKYNPPKAMLATCKQIHDLLLGMMSDTNAELCKQLETYYTEMLSNFLDKRQAFETPRSYFEFSPDVALLVGRILNEKKDDTRRYNEKAPRVYTRKPGYKAMIRSQAESDAKDMQANFVGKNITKLSAIVERKGNFESAVLIRVEVRSGVVEGSLLVKFTDGSNFKVNSQVVWSTSCNGRRFVRYPTTFHEVLQAGKKSKAMAPEAWMVEKF
jgi:hypothetical protein